MPRHRFADTAKTAPRDFVTSTGVERRGGIVKPLSMVFNSGMPEPEVG